MKRFYYYLWTFSSIQIISFSTISCFNVPKYSSVYNVPNYWSGGNICAATIFLWSLTCCTSNSHRLPEILATKQREGKDMHHMKTMKSKSKKTKSNGDTKKDRQGLDVTGDIPNEVVIIEDLRKHLISKLGVLDPMMCLPKALCGLSSASTASPNSSSELVKDYLHHMKTVILTTTPTPPISVTEATNATNDDLKTSDNKPENSDDEESESEDTEEDEEDEENDDTSEEEDEDEEEEEEVEVEENKDKFYDNYNKYRNELLDEEDNEDEDLPTESDEQLLRDYLTDKTEVSQYMDEEDFEDTPSWWDNVPTKEMTIPITPISWASSLTSYIPSSMTSWLTSALPSFNFDYGAENRKEGIFDKDPFFTTFRSGGRSLSDGSTGGDRQIDPQLAADFQAKLNKRRKILNQYRRLKKKIKRRQQRMQKGSPRPSSLRKILKKVKQMNKKKGNITKVVLSKRIIQQELLDGMDSELSEIENPIKRLQTAVEIGKKLDDPRKCDILFSACPWKYDEVLEIIEDSHKSVKAASAEVKDRVKKKTTQKEKGGKGSALEKLKQTLKANSKNSSIPGNDLTKETVVKHPLPGGGHLEVKFSHSESNNIKKNNSKKKFAASILKPFQETKYLGVKTENKKKKQKKPIDYKYPKYNYRVSFPNTDHKSIIISQYEEITTKRPKKMKQTTTEEPTTTVKPKKEKTKLSHDINDINVEDSGENIIIRIPKEKSPPDAYNRNPLLFNPFRIYSPQYPSYTNQQPQPYPAPAPTPTLVPTPQYYNQYYQPQYQLQPQPQLQPTPWYYYNTNRNNYQYKRAWQPNHNRDHYFKNNIN